MKSSLSVSAALTVAALTASALAFSPLALQAQDQPPPPMDQSAAPPPPDQSGGPQDQGAPPPDQSAPPPDQGGGDSGASFDQFYSGLSSEGQWIQTPDYGYVFQPEVTDPNWAPYTEGHWVYTDYGWTWASDEPWGWATYHYGRWVNIDGTGWAWVPGYEWAPAWVSWRYGGGYCGWAPLPPSTFVGVEFGGPRVNLGFDFHFGSDVDTAYGIGPGYYNFIQIGFIGDPSYHRHYLDRGRNFTIINNTTNITNIYVSRHPGAGAFSAVRAQGPALEQVNAVSHTRVQQVRLAGTSQAGTSRLSGGTLAVYAPHINASTLRTSRPANVSRTLSTVKVNRGTNVSQPLQVNERYKPEAPSAEVVSAAKAAQLHAPANVATANRIKPSARLSAPLSSMQTVASQRAPAAAGGNAFAPTANAQVQHPAGVYSNGATQQQPRTSEIQQTPSYSNSQAQQQREEEVRQQQAQTQAHSQQQHDEELRQQQAQTQERSQQQREDEERKQQAATQERSQQREDEVRQQQAQVQSQQHSYQQEAVQQQQHTFAQPQVQQHVSQPPVMQQHVSQPQVQQHASAPPAQHPAPGGGGSGGGGGDNKNKNQNGSAQSH